MHLIYLGLTLGLIWLNLAGLTLFCRRWLPDFALARTCGILLLALVLFFVEHFVGLGKLNWVWPLSSLASAYILNKNRDQLRSSGFWGAELVFGLAFLYGFIWRFTLPNINVSSERVTDLYFIANYINGDTLPPEDNWNPPHKFDFYYAFQHYLAALVGRIFNLDVGTTYNLSFCILLALPATLTWSLAGHFMKSAWLKLLLVVALVWGGSGLTPLIHAVYKYPAMPEILQEENREKASERDIENAERSYNYQVSTHAFLNLVRGARFTGSHDDKAHEGGDKTRPEMAEIFFPVERPLMDKPIFGEDGKPVLDEKGKAITEKVVNEDFELRVLPIENYGYQFFVGDYHPPMGGFAILLMSLALMVAIKGGQQVRICTALLGTTIPLALITNTWVFPLQGFVVCGWLAYSYINKQKPDWAALMGGGIAAGLLAYPFLIGFTSGGSPTPVKLVEGYDHTPVARFIGTLWPAFVLMVLALFDTRWRKWSVTLFVTFALLWTISECIYIDDPTGGKYLRTNTVMKWWGWIYVACIVLFGAICLGSKKWWVKAPAILVLLAISTAGIDVVRYLANTNKAYAGKMHGHEWFTQRVERRDMFNFLKQSPRGIVLENVPKEAYMESSVYSIFNDKPVLLGWPSHLRTWHGDVPQVWKMTDQIRQFYKGKLGASKDWLMANKVKYIIFTDAETQQQWDLIHQQIQSEYAWFGFNRNGQRPMGIWVKK